MCSYLAGSPQYHNHELLTFISTLNIIFAAHPNCTQSGAGVAVGQNGYFFPTVAQSAPLGDGLEAWRGFYSSVRPSFKQLMANVNVCTAAFYFKENLADIMLACANTSSGARMIDFVEGIRVKTDYSNNLNTVKGFAEVTARQYTFYCTELGGKVTFEEYIKRSVSFIILTLMYGLNKMIYFRIWYHFELRR
jgi:eukaryotic translation initiation factor 2C